MIRGVSLRKFAPVLSVAIGILGALSFSQPAHAYYDGAHLIDDGSFLNATSMDAGTIQTFLQNKGSGLASMSFLFDCASTGTQSDQAYMSAGAPCGQTVPASTIIYYASQVYGVNPKVVLATLQKEQALVTSPTPTSWQINEAMGYGCPDSGGCSASNFLYQIDNGVWTLRFHFERARGNMTYWFTSTSWVCGSAKNYYTPSLYPGQNVNFYDDNGVMYRTYYLSDAATSSLYCYTPHAYNNPQGLYGLPAYGTTGLYYSGSYNFVLYYERWFGPTTGPAAFMASGSNTVYIPVDQYKMAVPYAAAMLDYGISWAAVQTVSQQYVDSIPAPDSTTGLSLSISHVVKSPSDTDADGASVYLISMGKRYQFQSMQQFYDFGFTDSDISYLPLYYILGHFNSGGMLSDFFTTPYGSVFQENNGVKNIIFEYPTFSRLDPTGGTSSLSYYLADKIPSGTPLTDRPVLLQYSSGSAVQLYSQGQYSSIPNYDVYQCWGFETTLHTPIYRLPQDNYISPVASSPPVGCTYNENGNTYLLNFGLKTLVPPSLNLTGQAIPSQLSTFFDSVPPASHQLSSYVKDPSSPAVWYITNAKRRIIPTYNTFLALGLSSINLDTVSPSFINSLTYDGVQLATGQIVKSTSSATVYITGPDARYAFPTSSLFLAYKNNWNSIDAIDATSLDQNYPASTNVSPLLADKAAGKLYLVASNGCFQMDASAQTAFGSSESSVASSQPYDASIFKNLSLNSCPIAPHYAKIVGQSLVYWIDGGQKYPIETYSALLQKNGGQEPVVISTESSYLNTLPTGAPVY